MVFELPKLPYAYNALEPHIDEKTMQIHHTKHHQAYIDKLNAALEGHGEFSGKTIEELIKNLNTMPENIKMAVRNHGGGHLNHSFFWQIMAPKSGGKPSGELAKEIDSAFGSFDEFKKKFSDAGIGRFGSGWAWLVFSKGKLEITSTQNQDNPITEGKTPILGIDVWEHSYYILYNQRRADYIAAWWNVVNWKKVEENFSKAKK